MAEKDLIRDQRKVKKPAGAPMQVVVQKIEVNKRFHRTEQDIPNWRRAIQNAESQIPRRNLLYNLYADVELDGHVEAVWSKRQDAVTDANWKFVDEEGKDIDEINDLIDSVGFDELLREIINSKSWGYTILEPVFWKDAEDGWEMDAGLIPRLFYRPEIGRVAYDIVGDNGIDIREGIYTKTLMEVGNVTDLGLYMKAAPYQVLKRGGLGDYAAFIQTFGNPLIDAVWDGYDEKQRQQLNDALLTMGAGGTLVRPKGTEVDMKENRAKDTGDAHGSFLRFLNSEISKALLGTTETTESSQSSGYAQSKTHEGEDTKKHDTDITYVRKVLNSRFKKILRAHGFNTANGRFIVQGEDQELTKQESFEIHKGLINEMGLPVDDDFLYEFYGLPKPDNYNALKEEQAKAKNEQAKKENAQEPEKGKGTEPGKEPEPKTEEAEVTLTDKSIWQKLFEPLRNFFAKAPVPKTTGTGAGSSPHTINLTQEQDIDDDALIKRVWDAQGSASEDVELYQRTAQILEEGFLSGWKTGDVVQLADGIPLGVDYGADDPTILATFLDSIFKFSAGKTAALLERLNELFRESSSFEEFYQMAKSETDLFNKAYLETEYTTAVLTGEAASTYKRLKGQADIFPYWMYRSAGDDLVRPAHRLLEGMVLRNDHSAWKSIYPPNGWRCRCYIVPRMENEVSKEQLARGEKMAKAYLESPAFERERKAGWAANRIGEGFVFSKEQQYGNEE